MPAMLSRFKIKSQTAIPSVELLTAIAKSHWLAEEEFSMDEWLNDFKQTIESASERLAKINEAESSRPREDDHWSSKQIIGHLIDSAANNHARFVVGQLKEDLVFPGYDQNGWVKTNHYQERPWSELIELWRAYNLHLQHLMTHADRARLSTPCTLQTL